MSQTPHRPLSPHLQIWRWHITMFSSIMHRVTGSGNVAGLLLVTAWLLSLGLGRETYTCFLSLAASPLGLILWFLLSLSAFVHIMGGIRHFIWDLGFAFAPKNADTLAYITLVLAVVLDLAFWAYLILSHKVLL